VTEPAETSTLTAHEVSKSFGATPALIDVSVAIATGEIVAITGSSGSGKSTLLHCLSGILLPDSGEISYGETRIDTLPDADRSKLRRSAFGVLFQFGQLVPELTAIENITLPLMLAGESRRPSIRRAEALLERLGIGELGRTRPGEMSGGQGQRVALARALITDPRVLFADEPTGALDSLTGETVLSDLVRTARATGMTVVIVTHDAKVAAYADREIVMRDGRIDLPTRMHNDAVLASWAGGAD
jgi:putative ABC transport system ATP-binding protein